MANVDKANKAAEALAKSTADSYKTVVDHAVALQERNAKFVSGLFDGGVRELRQQAESNRALVRELVERAVRQREAFQNLFGESVDAYTNLAYKPLGYYKRGLRLVEREVTEGGFPISNYDDLNVGEINKQLDGLSAQELRVVREYEKQNKNRETVIGQIDRKLKPAS